MDIRLFINEFQVDLDPDQKISYTKQVNSIQSMADRQANYSKSIKVPKTARNIKYFKGLGIDGSASELPYQKNTARLFVRNLCLIYKGWANFLESGEDYFDINIYDGNIDFFKALDNLKFDEIPMPELEHTKTVQAIIDAWNNDLAYKYFIADYNGKTFFTYNNDQYLNIDYMVPNIPCTFLWNKIFDFLGFQFEMQAFTDEQFTNNYLTYPKGVRSGEVGDRQVTFSFDEQSMTTNTWLGQDPPLWLLSSRFQYDTDLLGGNIISHPSASGIKLWEVFQDGYYELTVTGHLDARAKKGVDSYMFWGKNLHLINPNNINQNLFNSPNNNNGGLVSDGGDIDFTINLLLKAGDTITFIYDIEQSVNRDDSKLNFEANISNIDQTQIGQTDFFKGLSVKDFFREILWRFGLTPYTSKDEDKIDFLTWEERINGTIEDWSDRFQGKISESYSYDSYGKKNWLRYKYNEEFEDFNDGVFIIENDNLDESRDVIKSKTYSREREEIKILIPAINDTTEFVPKLQLWEQELKADSNNTPTIEYKSLDSRYIFIHKNTKDKAGTRIGSEQLGEYGTANSVDIATTGSDDSMQKQVQVYYSPLLTLINKTKIIKASFRMNIFEFDNFDMKPRIYVKQLRGEFIVDKLTKDDLTSDFATAELIKINR